MADGIREDVNLIDVLDFIADCVMAGMARSGSVYPLKLDAVILERAFQNTVEALKSNVMAAAPAAHLGSQGIAAIGRGADVASVAGKVITDPLVLQKAIRVVAPRRSLAAVSLGKEIKASIGRATTPVETTTTPVVPEVPPLYDEIAQAYGKPYSSLNEADQAMVRRIADAKTAPTPTNGATKSPAQLVARPAVPFEPPPSKYAAQLAARDKLTGAANEVTRERVVTATTPEGKVTTPTSQPPEVAEPARPVVAPATESRPAAPAPQSTEIPGSLAEMARQMNAETAKGMAELGAKEAAATEKAVGKARATKAVKWADFLSKGVDPGQAPALADALAAAPEDYWKVASSKSGLGFPSATTIKQIVEELRKQ